MRKGGQDQEEGDNESIEEVMMMSTVRIFKIGYVQSRGILGQIFALRGAKSLYGI